MASKRYWRERRERALVHYEGTKREDKPIAVVDIETRGLGGEFIYGACVRESDRYVEFFDSPAAWVSLFHTKRYRGHIWYAHNGGEYDYKYLLQSLLDSFEDGQCRLVSQGSAGRTIGAIARRHKRRYELRDSFSLAPMSLDELTTGLDTLTRKGHIDFEKEDFDPSNPVHVDYLRRDVLSLLDALLLLRGHARAVFDIPLAWTAGSTALRAWRRTLDPQAIYWRAPETMERFSRRAYYGGLVTLTSLNRHEDVHEYDVNAMYAAAMRRGVPYGSPCWTDREIADVPGIYDCRVHVPRDSPFTFIPYRHDHMLAWPTGEFGSVLDSETIAAARARGMDVDVATGVVFDEVIRPFDAFLNKCEELELQGGAYKTIAKLLRNALYGKFGSRPVGTTYCFWPDDEDNWAPVVSRETGEFYGLFEREEKLSAPYLHPEWAAWITAQARLILLTLVELGGAHNVLYTDTDSLKVPRDMAHPFAALLGLRYGELKLAHDYTWFQAGGPKNYVFCERDAAEPKSRLKGVPARALAWEDHVRALGGESVRVSFTSLNATRIALGERRTFAQQRTRTIGTLAGSPGWQHVGGGLVRPIHVKE